jgi:outer membrane protein OmpA-like peptidoglycan-associated protein
MAFQDCDSATDLFFYAYHLHYQGGAASQQKLLFNKSLQLCPNRPEVHSILGSVLKKQGKYSQAIFHYKQALKLRPDFSEAWHGLGETYYKQGRFPLSLEAYLQACQTDENSKAQVEVLLKNKRYAFTGSEEIIDRESLLVLYDLERLMAINDRLSDCGLHKIRPAHTFFNLKFYFGTDEGTLQVRADGQLDEIVAAMLQLNSAFIHIHGHADTKRFSHLSQAESERENRELSQIRADVVATALAQRGVSMRQIEAYGHSYHCTGYIICFDDNSADRN